MMMGVGKEALIKALIATLLAFTCAGATARDVLRVGTTPAGAPFTFIDTDTGQTEGVMVDLIKAIAKDNGFDVSLQPMQFSTLVSALVSRKLDIVSASMSATESRKKVVSFSDEVYNYGEGLMVRASDKKPYKTVQDLKGDRVGTVIGTDYTDVMRATGLFSEVAQYDSTADIMRDIEAGRLDAGFGDGPVLTYRFEHSQYPKLRLVDTYQPIAVGLGISIAVRKDEGPLLNKINASIRKFKADGTLKAILAKWKLK